MDDAGVPDTVETADGWGNRPSCGYSKAPCLSALTGLTNPARGTTTRAAIPLRLAALAYPYIACTQRSVTSLSVVKCDVGHIS
jgi:hypothetical protein